MSYISPQGGLIINTASAAGIIFGDQDPALVGFDILYPDYLQCDSHVGIFSNYRNLNPDDLICENISG